MRTASRQAQKKLALDQVCKQCGGAVYYNYSGPIEGICGRCADKVLSKRPKRETTRTVVVEDRESRAWIWITVFLAFAAGALAGFLAHDLIQTQF